MAIVDGVIKIDGGGGQPPVIKATAFSDQTIITDNSTGEQLEIFATKVTPRFINGIKGEQSTAKPGDASTTPGDNATPVTFSKASIADAFLRRPLSITIQGFLAHKPEPGVPEGSKKRPGVGNFTWGSSARPIDLYEIGRRFFKRDTTFQFQTPGFPGVVIDDLLIVEYTPVADSKFDNVYPVTIRLETILITEGQQTNEGIVKTTERGKQQLVPSTKAGVSKDGKNLVTEAKDAIESILPIDVDNSISRLLDQANAAVKSATGIDVKATVSSVDKIFNDVGKVVSSAKSGDAKGVIGAGKALIDGILPLFTGSLPDQRFNVVIRGKEIVFNTYWEDPTDVGYITATHNGINIIDNYPLQLGLDVFSKVQSNPVVQGIHLLPVNLTNSTSLTKDNIGKGIQMLVVSDRRILG